MASARRDLEFDKPGWTQVPNSVLDNMDVFTKAQLRVLLSAIRITIGYHKKKARLSISNMQRETGLSKQSVLRAAADLEDMDLLARYQDGGVTIWSVVFADEPKQTALDFEDVEGTKGEMGDQLMEMYPMAKLICRASNVDWIMHKGRAFSTAKKLMQAGYTIDDVKRAFGPGGLWETIDWRGQKGGIPTMGQITTEIRGLLEKGHAMDKKAGKAQVGKDGSLKI